MFARLRFLPTPVLLLALALGLAHPARAAAKKQSAVAVRFYAEGGAEGGDFSQPVELISSKRKTFMQSMPLVSEREIVSFFPFQARDGSGTFGASFRLDPHGTNLLSEHTMSRRGSYILAYFNGRHVIDLYVDRGVTDGIITIPSGLSANDISLLNVSFPLMGHEKEKPAKQPKAPKPAKPKKAGAAATPSAADMPHLQPAMQRQPDGRLVPASSSVGAATDGELVPAPLSPIGQ
jgi:hypothetical protein